MAEQNGQNIDKKAVVGLPHKPKGGQNKSLKEKPEFLSQDRVYEILSKGVIYTMEDDLKEAQKMQLSKVSLIPKALKEQRAQVGFKPQEQALNAANKEVTATLEQIKKEEQPKEPIFKPKPISQPKPQEETIKQEVSSLKEEVKPEPKEPIQQSEEFSALKAEVKATPPLKDKISSTSLAPSNTEPLKSNLSTTNISIDLIVSQAREIKKKLKIKRPEILKALRRIPNQELPLQKRRKEISLKIRQLENELDAVLKDENAALQGFKTFEEKEANAQDFKQKHFFEEKRWVIEEKKREFEEKRWALEEEIEKFNLTVGNIEKSLRDLNRKALDLEQERQFYVDISEILSLLAKQGALKDLLILKDKSGESVKEKKERVSLEVEGLKEKILRIKREEGQIENEIKILIEKEKQAQNPKERRKFGQERWQMEKQRKLKEEERWAQEKQAQTLQGEFVLSKEKFEKIDKELSGASKKIEDIFEQTKHVDFWDNILEGNKGLNEENVLKEKLDKAIAQDVKHNVEVVPSKVPSPFEALKREKELSLKPEEEKRKLTGYGVEQKGEAQEERVMELVKKNAQQQKTKAELEEKAKEQAEQKAKKLKEIEKRAQSEKERERKNLRGPLVKEEILKRLTRVSEKEEAQRQEFLARVAGKSAKIQLSKEFPQEPSENVVFHPLTKKSSLVKKILVRTLIILIAILFFGFVIWQVFQFFEKRQGKENQKIPFEQGLPEEIPITSEVPEAPEIPVTSEAPVTSITSEAPVIVSTTTLSEITLQQAVLEVGTANLLSFSNQGEIPLLFANVLTEELPSKTFQRIIFASSTANEAFSEMLALKELGVVFVPEFESRIEKIDILLYKAEKGLRIVLVGEAGQGEVLSANFAKFEKSAFASFKPLFEMLGFSQNPLSAVFRVSKTSPKFKYQTVSKDDLGVCYLIYGNYFVVALSYEAMEEVINLIQSTTNL